MRNHLSQAAVALILSVLWLPLAQATEGGQPVLVDIKRMSLDTALKLAQASIQACRKEGVQVAVTVVDRGGHPQVVLRDVLAQDLTLEISKQKAYTAMTFNSVFHHGGSDAIEGHGGVGFLFADFQR